METLQEQRRRAAKPLLWIGIGSIIMAFAGLTSGYVVSRTTLVMNEQWMTFALPKAFIYSTVVIVLSSLALIWGKRQLVAGKDSAIKPMLWVTLLLGFAFLWFQGGAWTELVTSSSMILSLASLMVKFTIPPNFFICRFATS